MKEKIKNILEIIFILIIFLLILFIIKQNLINIMWNYNILKRNETKFSFAFPFINKNITNDTLFTIAIGRNVLKNGVTNLDTLTFHERLKFPHSGIFDIIIASIYEIGGFDGIYLYTALIALAIFLSLVYIYYHNTKELEIAIIYAIGMICLSQKVFVARAQEISFLLFIWEFYFIEKLVNSGNKKYSIVLILLGILIANFHSSVYPVYFIMYLPYIALLILRKLNNKKIFLITFGISLFTGFCSTAGIAPYTDMIKAMIGVSTEFIGELSVSTWWNNKEFYISLILIFFFSINVRKEMKLTDVFYIIGFGAMAIYTFRCRYFFWIVAGIASNRIFVKYINSSPIFKNTKLKNTLLTLICIMYVLLSIKSYLWIQRYNDYISKDLYPVQVTDYILENVDYENMRIFNGFNYGSYLEFKGIKTFIDSRSGMFTEEFNPGCTVLEDWLEINEDSSKYEKIFDKYKITHVVTQNGLGLNERLEEDKKYNKIYEDKNFSLFEKVED